MNPNRLSFTPKASSFRVSLVVGALALLAASGIHAQTFSSGSTGADGAFAPTVNTEVDLPPSGVLNYTSVSIPTGVTVTFKKNAANTPVYLLATENVTIAGSIFIGGLTATATGTYGDGLLGDDGVPGAGGAGGFDGGRGGREGSPSSSASRGGAGMGPGGGPGGIEGGDSCNDLTRGYYKHPGVGGGYASDAKTYYAVGQCGATYGTAVGKAYGSALLQPLIGGSGGGGGRGGSSYPGSGGGGGGGALLIAATGTISLTGSINARGGDGGGNLGTGAGGQGAGGSGGAIRMVASSISGNGSLYADGGCIQYNNSSRQYCGATGSSGYGGAPGRIRLEASAITFSGSVSPTQTVSQPGPVFIAGAPSLRIASVSGQTVPANPTGNADVTLPATTTGPVDVTFETANVPVGNTVLLRVVPAYGNVIEALSPALAGTAASGNATVSVTLPSGPSVLQATTTYTVVVAGTVDLSRFALNEAVDKVEITVPLQGEPTARVITATGKSYVASYEALRAAGFKG